jgi:hypothetical protein
MFCLEDVKLGPLFLTLADSEEGAFFFFCRALPKQQNAEVGLRFISKIQLGVRSGCVPKQNAVICVLEFPSVNRVRGFILFDQISTLGSLVPESLLLLLAFVLH